MAEQLDYYLGQMFNYLETTDDPRWECVDIKAVRPLANPVTLDMCKTDPRLNDMVLVNNSRLSVQPVTDAEWRIVCDMGNTTP